MHFITTKTGATGKHLGKSPSNSYPTTAINWIFSSLLALALIAILPETVKAEKNPSTIPATTEIVENLGEFIDLGLVFKDHKGEVKKLEDIVKRNRPFIVVPVYYKCPRLCSLTLNELSNSLDEVELELGEDFSVLTVSFDPAEGPELAEAKGAAYHETLENHSADFKGWPFVVGAQENINTLMKQIGFNYAADGADFSHASVYMVASPEGKITRYFYGFPIKGKSLRLALVEASEGIIGSTLDRVLLYCFRFDHIKGQYTLAILNLSRVIGALSLLGVTALLVKLRFF